MKKTIIILSVAALVLTIAIGSLLFLRRDEDTWICKDWEWVKHGNPSTPMPTMPCGTAEALQGGAESSSQAGPAPALNDNPELIGGQKDEHGCLIGAGYSWCEPKQKCLRAWEEGCP